MKQYTQVDFFEGIQRNHRISIGIQLELSNVFDDQNWGFYEQQSSDSQKKFIQSGQRIYPQPSEKHQNSQDQSPKLQKKNVSKLKNGHKHLLVTIKMMDPLMQFQEKDILARDIWKIFKEQKEKKNKEILAVPFGEFQPDRHNELWDFYGFQSLLKECPIKIRQCQNQLRQKIKVAYKLTKKIQQQKIVTDQFPKRRYKNMQLTEDYISSFMKKIQNSPYIWRFRNIPKKAGTTPF